MASRGLRRQGGAAREPGYWADPDELEEPEPEEPEVAGPEVEAPGTLLSEPGGEAVLEPGVLPAPLELEEVSPPAPDVDAPEPSWVEQPATASAAATAAGSNK